jgi:hypothetical protein
MRLINTSTILAEEFVGWEIPPYGILSHTWGAEEVLLTDLPCRSSQSMRGFKKIEIACQLAKAEGLQHARTDTCCIDKCSSAELTEAINSMFRW